MKAVRVRKGQVGATLTDIAEVTPADDEVLLQVLACGVCATDIEAAYRPESGLLRQPEVTLGHEPAGRVVTVGRDVEDWKPGDRAAVSCIVACGVCRMCVRGMSELCVRGRIIGLDCDGAMAERMVAPAANLVRVPDTISDEIAAVLTDAVATPFHALVERGRLRAGEIVAIFGVGGLGQHAVLLARALGAGTVIAIDRDEQQLEFAMELGADHAVRADDQAHRNIRELTGGQGVDLAGVFVGAPQAVGSAYRSAARAGRIVVVGLTNDVVDLPSTTALARREISLIGSGGYTMADLEDLVALVRTGRVDLSRSVSHRVPLSSALDAFTILKDRVGAPRRVVIVPDQ